MLLNSISIELAQERREQKIAELLRERRLLAAGRRPESRSARRALGRSLVSIGSRLAAEPQPRLARSR